MYRFNDLMCVLMYHWYTLYMYFSSGPLICVSLEQPHMYVNISLVNMVDVSFKQPHVCVNVSLVHTIYVPF
jgi:hypothetical protein